MSVYARMIGRPQTNVCTVNPADSSTYEELQRDVFNISYVDGSSALGDYFEDTFEVAGATIDNFQMGLGTGSLQHN